MSTQRGDERDSPVEPEWAQISSIAVGLDDHRLPSTEALAGRTLLLSAANETPISLRFVDESNLLWEQGGDEPHYGSRETAGRSNNSKQGSIPTACACF